MKSKAFSSASSSTNKSKMPLRTSSIRASGRSILLITTIGLNPHSNAFRNTNRVCGITPSAESTRSKTPSAIFNTRSTSPPKSACPGVSIRLIFVSPIFNAMFLARMVIPRSFSKSLESRMQTPFNSLSRNIPDCFSI